MAGVLFPLRRHRTPSDQASPSTKRLIEGINLLRQDNINISRSCWRNLLDLAVAHLDEMPAVRKGSLSFSVIENRPSHSLRLAARSTSGTAENPNGETVIRHKRLRCTWGTVVTVPCGVCRYPSLDHLLLSAPTLDQRSSPYSPKPRATPATHCYSRNNAAIPQTLSIAIGFLPARTHGSTNSSHSATGRAHS
jgi:hypothetical protein